MSTRGRPGEVRPRSPLPLPDPPLADAGTGIVLRPWGAAPGDAAALAAAWADPAVARASAVPPDRSEDAAARWIAGEPARRAAGLALDLVVAAAGEAGGATVLGEVGLAFAAAGPAGGGPAGAAEIGFWVAPPARGRGVATASVRLLSGWALAARSAGGLGLRLVWARTSHEGDEAGAGGVGDDGPAGAVLARAGFERRGVAAGSVVWRRVAATLRA